MQGATRVVPWFFAATIAVSAFLLFSIQPMFTKMVLPLLGGAPTVWSIALVFFQATLLGGYAFAHLIVRRVPLGVGALIHLGTLAAAAAMLPIALASSLGSPPTDNIAFWLIGLFVLSIGLPFAALATTAPLLQSWFAASGHSRAGNPYVLYAASNLGSFAGLFAYPTLIEPLLPLHSQARIWSAGFAAFILLISTAGLVIARRATPLPTVAAAARIPAPDKLRWVALAAIPAGLVIAVTSYVATDLASAPFLWVLPLAVSAYLRCNVSGPAMDLPFNRGASGAVRGGAAFDRIARRPAAILGRPRRRQSCGICSACAALPWRTLSTPPSARAFDGILSMDVARRSSGRHVRRDCRSTTVYTGV